MDTLDRDLSEVCNQLFAKPGTVITSADIPTIEANIHKKMQRINGWVLDDVNITLDDAAEFIDINVTSGKGTASIALQWQDARGNYWLRVDTDGDGL